MNNLASMAPPSRPTSVANVSSAWGLPVGSSTLDLAVSQSQSFGPPVEFKRRSFLPTPQTRFWLIQSGFVRTLSYREDGVTVAIGLWGPGDVVGHPLSTTDPYLIEAVTPVHATEIAAADWHPPATVLLKYLQQTEALMLARASYRVDMALLGVLRWLANRFGQNMDQGCLIDLHVTHQDLADFSGTTRVTVTRLLRQFEEQGLIYRNARQLILAEGHQHWHYSI